MKNTDIQYTKEESRAFILFYCAQIDFTLSREELMFIISKTHLNHISNTSKEIYGSNDFQIIQKIQLLVEKYWQMEADKNRLLKEIKDLFLIDGKWNQMERNLYRGFNQLFSA